MENNKVKFEDLVQEVAMKSLHEALGKVRPRYKDIKQEDLALVMGLSESQFSHLANSALKTALSENIHTAILDHFAKGDSIEFKNSFNVYVHESTTRVNEETGESVKKISVRTRQDLKKKLNTHM